MRFLVLSLMFLLPLPALGAEGELVVVIARLEDGSLKFAETVSLKPPLHDAGYYVNWTNEQEFLSGRKLMPNTDYRIEAKVIRSEVQQFPEGWKERTGKLYTIFYLQAVSATPAAGRSLNAGK